MASIYNLNHVNEVHPFMTCLVKVNTQYNWQKTIAGVLNTCHGVYNFRVDKNGFVEISGTVDPSVLLTKLGRAGRRAELQWFQFGECSSNLFMPSSRSGDGRFLRPDNITRPRPPSQENVTRPFQSYDYNHGYVHHDHGYGHHGNGNDNHGYVHHDHGYGHHGHGPQYYGNYGYRPGRCSDDDMGCYCTIM